MSPLLMVFGAVIGYYYPPVVLVGLLVAVALEIRDRRAE